MHQEGMDFVILTAQKNVEYFTGYRTLTWAYHARPLFCLVDEKDLLVVASRTESRNLASMERMFQWVSYDGYLAEGVQALLSEVARRRSKGKFRVGIDYGQDMFGRGSLDIIDGLRANSGTGGPRSATSLIWRVRMIKSTFEAGLKRTAFEIVNRAFDEAVASARLGMSEMDLCRAVQARIMALGADRADPIAMIFGRGDFVYSRPPGTRPLGSGDYVWTDFRAAYGGYPADRNRIARGGGPELWEEEAYRAVRSLTITLARSTRPGMTCGDLYAAFEKLWRDADLPPPYGLISRIGHGGGLDVTEPPSIARNSCVLVQPGMILHLEPKLELDGAVFQFEEVIHVRAEGVEFLSSLSPEEMPVIQ
jgi:Xaa-Pro aminopeptidase